MDYSSVTYTYSISMQHPHEVYWEMFLWVSSWSSFLSQFFSSLLSPRDSTLFFYYFLPLSPHNYWPPNENAEFWAWQFSVLHLLDHRQTQLQRGEDVVACLTCEARRSMGLPTAHYKKDKRLCKMRLLVHITVLSMEPF